MLSKTKITNHIKISEELFILEVEYPYSVNAGQFFMIKLLDKAHILPRPISIFEYNTEDKKISFLIRKRGIGSEMISQYNIGQSIEIIGSLGNGFDTSIKNKKCILVSGGEGIAPMLLLSKNLQKDNQLKLLAGFRYHQEKSTLDYFDIEKNYTALDATNPSHQGLVTDLLEKEDEPDIMYICGPIKMMEIIYRMIRTKNWNTTVYVSMESHMACGVGACMGCTIKNIHNQPLKICTEGPIFNAEEIFVHA